MTTEQYSIGYDEGYQDGWNAAMESKPAQPQQEHLSIELLRYHLDAEGYMVQDRDGEWIEFDSIQQPAQRKPLTDEQIADILPDDDTPMSLGEAFVKFARAVEAAHGIKGNT